MRHFAPTHRRFRGTSASRPILLVSAAAAVSPSKDRHCSTVESPVHRILPARIAESAPARFRFSIKRKVVAPEETPHPENPACNKRRLGHTRCPNHHSIHLKYHRNGVLSSRKRLKKRFFCDFCDEKAAFSQNCREKRFLSAGAYAVPNPVVAVLGRYAVVCGERGRLCVRHAVVCGENWRGGVPRTPDNPRRVFLRSAGFYVLRQTEAHPAVNGPSARPRALLGLPLGGGRKERVAWLL